ncbi:putative membrane protein [Xanthomonas euvesicatoria pv. vesicatoria str. 85-10]|nr:putative membrane protein [Xanthomonas euvesicatoria pv. vesicatoria str. 85-10]
MLQKLKIAAPESNRLNIDGDLELPSTPYLIVKSASDYLLFEMFANGTACSFKAQYIALQTVAADRPCTINSHSGVIKMIQKKNRRCALAACSLSLVAMVLCMSAAVAAPVPGKDTVTLRHVFATLQNGQQDQKPEDVAACRKQVAEPTSKYLGVAVTTTYSIDVQSKMMTASASLPSPVATQPLMLTVPLSPLGLSGDYAFGAFRPSALPNTYVLFSVGLNFKDPKSSVLVLNSDKRYNCLVTSDPAPFQGALSSQLGKDQGR